MSVCFGVGESTFFSLLSTESSDSIGAFASGTGGAGIAGAGLYWVLIYLFNPRTALLMIATTIPVHAVVFLRLVLPSIRGIHSKRVDGCPGSKALSPAVSSFSSTDGCAESLRRNMHLLAAQWQPILTFFVPLWLYKD